jgi:hypothetical protein
MANLIEQAIACDDGDRAAQIIPVVCLTLLSERALSRSVRALSQDIEYAIVSSREDAMADFKVRWQDVRI